MLSQDPDDTDDRIDAHQQNIETLEVEINLKDASISSEGELNALRAAQQLHRNHIQDLKDSQSRAIGEPPLPEKP